MEKKKKKINSKYCLRIKPIGIADGVGDEKGRRRDRLFIIFLLYYLSKVSSDCSITIA